MSSYAKAIIAVVVAVLIAGAQAAMSALGDGNWTTEDTLVVILAILGAVGVYAIPNKPYVQTGGRTDPNFDGH
jgi:hypothetical protein